MEWLVRCDGWEDLSIEIVFRVRIGFIGNKLRLYYLRPIAARTPKQVVTIRQWLTDG